MDDLHEYLIGWGDGDEDFSAYESKQTIAIQQKNLFINFNAVIVMKHNPVDIIHY